MSNIIGLITVIVSVVIAGVLVRWVSKQHQRKEDKQRKKTDRQLLAKLKQERLQREQIERQRPEEYQQHEEVELKNPAVDILPFIPTTPPPEKTPSFASKLYDYLKSGEWEEADKETLKIMLKLAGREKEGWLDVASIQNFPSEALCAIDQLWEKCSNGHFGFSVQKRIWESVGGNLDADDKIRQIFGDRVGWRVNKNWLQVDDLNFKPSAPVGHLPAIVVRLGGLSWGVDGFFWEKRKAYEFLLSQKGW